MRARATVRFRSRREPFDWENEGRTGRWFGIEVIDEDDDKSIVGVPESVWASCETLQRGDWLDLVLDVRKAKLANEVDALRVLDAAPTE